MCGDFSTQGSLRGLVTLGFYWGCFGSGTSFRNTSWHLEGHCTGCFMVVYQSRGPYKPRDRLQGDWGVHKDCGMKMSSDSEASDFPRFKHAC